MGLEIDVRSVSEGSTDALNATIRDALASGRVHWFSWTDSQGNRHVYVNVDAPAREIER